MVTDKSMSFLRNHICTTVFIYSVSHLFVDAASLVCYFTLLSDFCDDYWIQVIVFLSYGIIAFATQSPLGLLADYLNRPVLISVVGCLLVAAAPFFMELPILALLLVGIGNSLFHISGGIITLSLAKGHATIPGFFVAPGTIGVMIGVFLGQEPIGTHLFFSVLLLILATIMLAAGQPFWKITNTTNIFRSDSKKTNIVVPLIVLAIVLLFLTIMMRSLVSAILTSPNIPESHIDETIILKNILFYGIPAAIFAGKMSGGFLADYWGWRYFLSVALCLSAILFYFSTFYLWLIIPAVFLVNMTMPVTVTAISNLLPKFPGFAFGLATLGYLVGVFLAMVCNPVAEVIFIFNLLTIVLFFGGISLYYANKNS
jgi:MFS family permease